MAESNFFEFAYDWRQSNRHSAKRLKSFIDQQLDQWRRVRGLKHAKVILLAHSMGGLVARYALEVLEAWPNCRALVTFGTPFRGSFDALQYIANGFAKSGFDLSDVLRTMPSIYELCPIYKGVEFDGSWYRAAECPGLPASIDRCKLRAGLAFHREIEAAVQRNQSNEIYLRNRFAMISVIGTEQPTLQSAVIREGRLVASDVNPPAVPEGMRGGDGRVPRVSAIALDENRHAAMLHCVDKHGGLQNNSYVLDDLRARLQQLQGGRDLQAIRGGDVSAPALHVALHVDELFMHGSPVVLTAHRLGAQAVHGAGLQAHIVQRIGGTMSLRRSFTRSGSGFELDLSDLPSGQFGIAVRSDDLVKDGTAAVHDVFEIADGE